MSRKRYISLLYIIAVLISGGCKTVPTVSPSTTILFDSEPRGAKVLLNGKVICESTPEQVSIPLTFKYDNYGFKSPGKRQKNTEKLNELEFVFIKKGFITGSETIRPDASSYQLKYPDAVFHIFNPAAEENVNASNAPKNIGELHVAELSMQPFDVSASKYERKDLNGQPCALIKVILPAGAVFEGNVVGKVEFKTNEYWVYMSHGSKMLGIKHPLAKPVLIRFSDHGSIDRLNKATTYRLDIDIIDR